MNTGLIIQRANGQELILEQATQTLELKRSALLRRTVNGTLIYTGMDGFQKYMTTIELPGRGDRLSALTVGEAVTVECLQRVSQSSKEDQISLIRPAVRGSVCVQNDEGKGVTSEIADAETIRVPKERGKAEVNVSYRPILHMRVTGCTYKADEWGDVTGTTLTLEEV